jgi:hypothetical protein
MPVRELLDKAISERVTATVVFAKRATILQIPRDNKPRGM